MIVQMALISVLIVLLEQTLRWWQTRRIARTATSAVQSPVASRTCKPDCPACQAEAHRSGVPPLRPALQVKKKSGRPHCVNTHWHFCPPVQCSHYGWVGLGNLVANGHPNGGRWRQLRCTVCGKHFAESTGTLFYRSRVAPERLCQIITALAEGVSLQAAARILGVDPDTVKASLAKAAQQMEAVSHYLIHDLQVWAAIDPFSKLLLATVVGDRRVLYAQLLIHAVVLTLAPGVVPLFLSDQWALYATALVTHFGHWVAVPRRFKRGRCPAPRWEPLPELQYAQVVKHRVGGRIVAVTQHVVFGSAQTIATLLRRTAHTVNTAFIERVNLTLRMHLPALGRKVLSFAKTCTGPAQQVSLGRTYYNFCLPHRTLRLPLPMPRPTRGSGSPQRWQARTPAMAAGLTDHVWSMQELLLVRIPQWRQEVSG